MNFDFQQILKASMILFAVIDIIGSIPIIIKIKDQNGGHIPIAKTSLISLGIMLAFLFVGEAILNLLGVDINSFAVAGSLILFALSLEMILGIQLFKEHTGGTKTASIVPLAFPIIAGAGSMTSIVSLRAEYDMINIAIAIVLNMIVVFIVLLMTKRIEKLLGKGGIAVLEKVFGIILLAIAVKLFTTNIHGLFGSFAQ